MRRTTVQGTREQVIWTIQGPPDDAGLDDVLSEVYSRIQVDAGLDELDQAHGIPHLEVEAHVLIGESDDLSRTHRERTG